MPQSFRIYAALALFFIACSAGAQTRSDYPKRPVRFIVAQTTGGSADFVGRIVAEQLGKRFGQQFVVDNRPGASGIIAAETTVKAPPDGHTLLLVTTSFGVNPGLYKKLSYDPLNDLAPITHIAYAPQILVVNPSLPVKSVKDLIALARALRDGRVAGLARAEGDAAGAHPAPSIARWSRSSISPKCASSSRRKAASPSATRRKSSRGGCGPRSRNGRRS